MFEDIITEFNPYYIFHELFIYYASLSIAVIKYSLNYYTLYDIVMLPSNIC